jgi:hypothetical protein
MPEKFGNWEWAAQKTLFGRSQTILYGEIL